ncbi:MAG: 2-C-methyl-D-erythritol 4-phosphate cytidylyltransferase [Clostridia bacterium]
MKNNPRVSAVIVAAGSGTRMGGISKPLITLGKKTVFERVIDAFCSAELIDDIIVVCKDKTEYEKLIPECVKPVTYVQGGKTRCDSVYNGVMLANGCFVCIHDCARPFIKPEDIDKLVTCAYKSGAACACTPVNDTIKYVDNAQKLIYTPKRDNLLSLQTPQIFKKDIYTVAYLKAKADNLLTTDDTAIVEHSGFKVEYLPIGSYNIKLTNTDDIKTAKAMVFLNEKEL